MLIQSYDVKRVLYQLWKDLDTPCSRALLRCCETGDGERFKRILDSVKPGTDPVRYRKARIAVDIVKKADYIKLHDSEYRERECLLKWFEAEKACRDTNRRIPWLGKKHSMWPEHIEKYMFRARKICHRILGKSPIECSDWFEGFGPGATLSNSRAESAVIYKLTNKPSITEGAIWFYPALPRRLRAVWGPLDSWEVSEAGRFSTVPKSYKIDRAIMIEPLVNAAIQRSLGVQIAHRLKPFLGDIRHLPERHKELARIGSLTGQYATLDMSAASDTIATEFVRFMLPPDWFRVLNYARTPCVSFDERLWTRNDALFRSYGVETIHRLEKFSSMGNGFTFELETLLFYSLAKATARFASSFGDDMIVDSASVGDTMEVLKYAGFTLNAEKSFWRGLFRESCGGDYLNGIYVKGETLKEDIKCVVQDKNTKKLVVKPDVLKWYDLHNRLYMLQEEGNIDLMRTLAVIRGLVPLRFRHQIPVRLGGGGFFHPQPRAKVCDSIHYYKVTVPQSKILKTWEDDFSPDAVLAAALLAVPSKGPEIGYGPVGLRVAWVPCS